ncbi:TPA: lipase family protein [Burkholderia vietnamiensis]|nr:lipase family protein [Burkholderia vietnamiensis]
MDFNEHFRAAQHLVNEIDDWEFNGFSWEKAYVSSVFSALAYEEVPLFELKKSKRAKVIPSDRYQAHVSQWETKQRRATIQELQADVPTEVVIRNRVVVTISNLRRVIFVSFRGTTLSFSDFKADLDARKVKYALGPTVAKVHRGFLDAVLDCADEITEKIAAFIEPEVPVYVTGHSLGGAMAAIFYARLAEYDLFRRRYWIMRRTTIPPATSCYTFGMPRYGDMVAKVAFPQPYHIFNELDAVPTLPPTILGYVDSADERCLNAIPDLIQVPKKGNFGLRSKKGLPTVLGISDHRMERYIERVDAMRP